MLIAALEQWPLSVGSEAPVLMLSASDFLRFAPVPLKGTLGLTRLSQAVLHI